MLSFSPSSRMSAVLLRPIFFKYSSTGASWWCVICALSVPVLRDDLTRWRVGKISRCRATARDLTPEVSSMSTDKLCSLATLASTSTSGDEPPDSGDDDDGYDSNSCASEPSSTEESRAVTHVIYGSAESILSAVSC